MCQFWSCLVKKDGTVLRHKNARYNPAEGDSTSESHTQIAMSHRLTANVEDQTAKIEILPPVYDMQKSDPTAWTFRWDTKPSGWTSADFRTAERAARAAHADFVANHMDPAMNGGFITKSSSNGKAYLYRGTAKYFSITKGKVGNRIIHFHLNPFGRTYSFYHSEVASGINPLPSYFEKIPGGKKLLASIDTWKFPKVKQSKAKKLPIKYTWTPAEIAKLRKKKAA